MGRPVKNDRRDIVDARSVRGAATVGRSCRFLSLRLGKAQVTTEFFGGRGTIVVNRVRLAVLGVIVSTGVLGGPAAHADTSARGGDNIVIVHNLDDGAVRARSRVVVGHNRTDTVDNENYAEAYSSCTNCRTVAAAIQVVLVEGSPTTFAPANAAVAVNDNCQFCETFAFARQFVITTDRQVSLNDDALERIDELNDQVAAVVRSGEAFDQMNADLDSLATQIDDVVVSDLQRTGSRADVEEHRDVREQHGDD
jgi:hypothetical protein